MAAAFPDSPVPPDRALMTLTSRTLTTTGPLAAGTLELLPAGKKGASKVAVADLAGQVVTFAVTGKGVSQGFKTQPADTEFGAMVRGGRRGVGDKLFVAGSSRVVGLTRKGKQFFELETHTTESILALYVEDATLYIATPHSLSRFTTDAASARLDSAEKIVALLGVRPTMAVPLLAAVAFANAVIGVFAPDPDDPTVIVPGAQVSLPSPATAMCHAVQPHPNAPDSIIIAGCADGSLVGVRVSSQSDVSPLWVLNPESGPHPSTPIRSMTCYSLLRSASDRQLIVGLASGVVAVYSLPNAGASAPHLDIHSILDEPIAGVRAGVIEPGSHNASIVVATFSGRIIALTPDVTDNPGAVALRDILSATGGSATSSLSPQEKEKLIDGLEKELVSLRFHARESNLKYLKATGSDLPVVRPATGRADVSFSLDAAHSAYVLSVESAAPLEYVLLESDVPLTVTLNRSAPSTPVISASPIPDSSKSRILYTLRPQHGERRINVIVRSIEGQAGSLQVYSVLGGEAQCGLRKVIPIRPLSLHARSAPQDPPLAGDSVSSLLLSGDVSLSHMFAWVASALPDMPDRLGDLDNGSARFDYVSVFLATHLTLELGNRPVTWLRLTSENLSALSIIKEVITKEAAARGVNLTVIFELGPSSVPCILDILRPRIDAALALARKISLLDSLRELADAPDPKLDPDLADIAANSDALRAEWATSSTDADYLLGILTDLYIDHAKFNGIDARSSVDSIIALVHAGDWDQLATAMTS